MLHKSLTRTNNVAASIASITDFFWRRGIFSVDNTGNVCSMEDNPEKNLRLLQAREGKQ